MKGKRKTLEEKVRILRAADGNKTILEVCGPGVMWAGGHA